MITMATAEQSQTTTRWFEDFRTGDVIQLGTIEVTEAGILAYAHQFDPLRIHTDKEWAERDGPFHGLIASGWHTASITSRLLVDGCFQHSAVICGLGMDDLQWPTPVRPGDMLSGRFTVTDTVPSRSKPDRGAVVASVEVYAQDDRIVMTFIAKTLIGLRSPGACQ